MLKRLQRILEEAYDLTAASEELAVLGRRFGLEHHLSPSRANLLRVFDWDPAARVLEIGAGCGAVTRFLSETFQEVVAVEGDPGRARAAATRVRNLNTVQVICAPFEDLPVDSFEVIVSIGVLEYAHLYAGDDQPHLAALKHMRKNLDDAGVLVLALENKLGLKYFAGAREDHSSIRFDSVEGYHRSAGRTAVTFGRAELIRMLRRAGFSSISFFFPFPDYKFTQAVVADGLDAQESLALGELMLRGESKTERGQVFEPHLAWREAMTNSLLPALANSFLVLASPAGHTDWDRLRSWDAAALSTSRRRCYWTRTDVSGLAARRPKVARRRIFPELECIWPLHQREYEHPLRDEASIALLAMRAMQHHRCDARQLAAIFRPWLEYLMAEAREGSLPGALLDATPENGVLVSGGYELVDRELIWARPVSLRVAILRGLYYVIFPAARRPGALRHYPGASVWSMVQRIAARAGLGRFSREDLRDFLLIEAELQATATGVPKWRVYRGLLRGMATRVPILPGPGQRPVVRGRVRRYAQALRTVSPW